jgi:integrase
VAHAEWCDLNFQKNVLHVKPILTILHRPSVHVDSGSLIAKLKARQGKAQSHDLIFPAENGGVQGHLLRILQNFVEDNGIKGQWELHKFRKTFATLHHEQGVSVRTLQDWLGHSDLETTMAYLKGSDAATTLKLRSIRCSKLCEDSLQLTPPCG